MVSELRPGDPRVIGPYRLVGRLGEGGMGQVFLGVSPGGRPAAVKAIRAELASDPQFRTRFGQEVAAARQVSGVYTAMVVDADVDGPVAWLATAYVAGPSLAEAVDGHGPLPEASLLALAAGLAESLSAIHAAGVVHRDLKPSNVLLAEDGPRVIDFGISHAAESSVLTQTGLVLGSPRFMSPEQAVGAEVGPPSDIFSLGAVLAFAATGRGPFGSGTTASLLYRVVHESPDLDQVPASVRPLVERCLAKDPAQRPTAAGVLAAVGDLQAAGDWLPDSIIGAFPGNAPPLPPASDPGAITAVDGQLVPLAALLSWEEQQPLPAWEEQQPPPGPSGPPGDGGRPRRRQWWPLLLALGIGGVVAVYAATFALTAATGHTPPPARSKPAAQVSAVPSTAHPTTDGPTSPAASHRATASASASPPATTPMSTAPTATASTTPASPTPTSPPSSSAPSSTPPSTPTPSSAPPTSPAPSSSAPTSSAPSTTPSTSASAPPTVTPSASSS